MKSVAGDRWENLSRLRDENRLVEIHRGENGFHHRVIFRMVDESAEGTKSGPREYQIQLS